MKKINSLKKNTDFQRIIKNNKPFKYKGFIVYVENLKQDNYHFGISVSKKLGNAVNRNLLKRRMRQILDEYKKELSQNEDYIIIMKENVKNISFQEMRTSFHNLMKKRRDYEK